MHLLHCRKHAYPQMKWNSVPFFRTFVSWNPMLDLIEKDAQERKTIEEKDENVSESDSRKEIPPDFENSFFGKHSVEPESEFNRNNVIWISNYFSISVLFKIFDLLNHGVNKASFLEGASGAFYTLWHLVRSEDENDLSIFKNLVSPDIYEENMKAKRLVKETDLPKLLELQSATIRRVGFLKENFHNPVTLLLSRGRHALKSQVFVETDYQYSVEIPIDGSTFRRKTIESVWTFQGSLVYPFFDLRNPEGMDPRWTLVSIT